jgi:hypothetical protein
MNSMLMGTDRRRRPGGAKAALCEGRNRLRPAPCAFSCVTGCATGA